MENLYQRFPEYVTPLTTTPLENVRVIWHVISRKKIDKRCTETNKKLNNERTVISENENKLVQVKRLEDKNHRIATLTEGNTKKVLKKKNERGEKRGD